MTFWFIDLDVIVMMTEETDMDVIETIDTLVSAPDPAIVRLLRCDTQAIRMSTYTYGYRARSMKAESPT